MSIGDVTADPGNVLFHCGSGYQAKRVKEWQSQGVEVLVSRNDVSTLEGAKSLVIEANALGPVGGIFHLAMVKHQLAPSSVTLSSSTAAVK